jgi:ADP-heptose:LPS heptosyltransferase
MSALQPFRLLVFRFSAIGDVAMTIPVLWSLTKQFPNIEITFVSRSFARGLLKDLPSVEFIEFDPKDKHKGLYGIFRLFRELNIKGGWDGIADLHDVLRTKILRFFFWTRGTRVAIIDKGRKEKRKLTRKNNKFIVPLKHTVIRYSEVFQKLGLGLVVKLDFKSLTNTPIPLNENVLKITGKREGKWIGIAPFAKHKGKAYPLEGINIVIEDLARVPTFKILLFGAKGDERYYLDSISSKYLNVINLAGEFTIDQELEIISNLNLMLSMDSANMHFASLVGVPVISIWGATHPFAGFYGWNQSPENAIQVELDCRPCSVFGNKPCHRSDYACLSFIEPSLITSKVIDFLCYNKN